MQSNFTVAPTVRFCYPPPAMTTALSFPLLRGPVALSHHILRSAIRPGDHAVDATCGNGSDTLLLAELVGPQGKVFACDIQPRAIATTRARLAEAGLEQRVTVVQAGHETIGQLTQGPLKAVVFNLGYLPGGDHSVTTRPETTCAALQQSLELLTAGGLLAITIYPGHDDAAEATAVEAWATGLEQRHCHVWRMAQANASPAAPYLLLVQRC